MYFFLWVKESRSYAKSLCHSMSELQLFHSHITSYVILGHFIICVFFNNSKILVFFVTIFFPFAFGKSGRRSSRQAFGRSTGNGFRGHYKRNYFPFFPFSVPIIERKLTGVPKNIGVETFPDPVGHYGAPQRPFWFCGRCGIAGGERVPPAPLGWYI